MVNAVVTGAANGIGAAIVDTLRGNGMRVFALDARTIDAPDALLTDVSKANEVEAAVAQINASTDGAIDVLVNNAGILIEGSLETLNIDDLDAQYAVNLRGPFIVTQAVLPHMQTGSTIINIASELAYLGRGNASAYAATKGAILSMSRSWAHELAPRIRVNCVAPGPIDTSLLNFAAMSAEQQSLEVANPMQRIGRPADVAAVVSFLASPDAGFITGQCYSVDGGAAMH